jgi:Protein of unknown function (DUF4236)
MGYFRFRRSFRLLPGVRVNFSKSGVSTSVGRRGLWFTIGPRGTRETIGIPGTGLSYTEQQRIGDEQSRARTGAPAPRGNSTTGRVLLWFAIIVGLLLGFWLAH